MGDINKSYSWAIDTCNAPNIGYSMNYRDQQYDPKRGCICYDCSSFIWYALKAGGFDNIGNYPFDTSAMEYILPQAGFTEVNLYGEWKKGDIVWRKKGYLGNKVGHTEMVYEGGNAQGITMGAHSDNLPLADQVSIKTRIEGAPKYQKLFRYGNGADGRGYSLYVISAILGNFFQESQINPGVWQDKQSGHTWTDIGVGYGLGQWTNISNVPDPSHGRLYDLGQYLITNNYPADSGDGQVAYLIVENIWFLGGTPSAYTDLQDFLNSTDTNLTNLTTEWYNHWEGMNYDDGSLSTRIQMAEYFYDYLLANANNENVTSWYAMNSYFPYEHAMEYAENNAIMFYRALGSGGGGGGAKFEKTMPVWMMLRKNFLR